MVGMGKKKIIYSWIVDAKVEYFEDLTKDSVKKSYLCRNKK